MSITYKEYNEKYRLPEQARDERLLLSKKHYCLCYEPGKGKSMPVIHCMQVVNKQMKGKANVLILSDATCIREMWVTDIQPMGVLPRNTYMVTDRTAIGKVKEALLARKWDIIVCDEAQSLRSGVTRAKSKYAKLVYQLTKRTEYVWGMTGTIAGNNNIEPFCVLHNLNIADCGNMNCHKFKQLYCEQELCYGPFGSFRKPTKLNAAGERFMQEAYAKGCSFWEYDDNDDMPPMEVEFKSFTVPATETYKNALDGILKCGESESTVIKTIAIQKAQQALNGFVYYDEESERHTFQVPQFTNPKLEYVQNEALKGNIIIAYRFQEDGYYITKALEQVSVLTTNKISEFKKLISEERHVVLVLQCSRGKAANLQEAQKIIYYTSDFSFIAYQQMIHRCWRRGQTKPCKVEFLCNDTGDNYRVEQKIWESLRKKQSIHETLMSIKNEEGVYGL